MAQAIPAGPAPMMATLVRSIQYILCKSRKGCVTGEKRKTKSEKRKVKN